MSHRQLHRDRRRPLSVLVAWADLHVQQRDDLPEGPAHVQGRRGRSSTRVRTTSTRSTSSRFPASTNNQNGRFEFTDSGGRRQHRHWASRTPRMGLFTNYAEIGQRALTKWRALVDRHLRAGLLAADQQPDGRGRRPLGDLAAVLLARQQHRHLRSGVLQHVESGGHRPGDRADRRRARATTASSCRATGSRARRAISPSTTTRL